MAELAGVRLIFKKESGNGFYRWDLKLPSSDTSSTDDEIDIIVLGKSGLGKEVPKQVTDQVQTPPYAKKANAGDDPEFPARGGGGHRHAERDAPIREHCVWVHRTDCGWEELCAPET